MSASENTTRSKQPTTSEATTILTSIRYPLTGASVKTLSHAIDLAAEEANAELLVLHINLYQNDTRAKRSDIRRAIRPLLGGREASVLIQSGFLLEDILLEEATTTGADHIVIGRSQKSAWRRVLSRLVGNDPEIDRYLREHTDATVSVVG